MRKTVNIDGREVKLVAHGATSILYKQEFGSDFFADLLKLVKSVTTDAEDEEVNLNELSYEQIEHIDFLSLYRIIYILAKSGNKDIPPMVDWLAEFDEFPVMDLFPIVEEVISGLLKRTKK